MIADPKTAGTYLGMTMMMSILPLGLIGGLVYWLWRRYSDKPVVAPKKVASSMGLSSSPLYGHRAHFEGHLDPLAALKQRVAGERKPLVDNRTCGRVALKHMGNTNHAKVGVKRNSCRISCTLTGGEKL